MKVENSLLNYKKIHFVGIGGVSMDALAKYCVAQNKEVTGSDRQILDQTLALKDLGVKLYLGHQASAVVGRELVVYTSAVLETNKEIIKAKSLGIPTVKRSKFLGEILSLYKNSICVAGSHGKTTTTAFISQILICAGVDPTVFLGGVHHDFGNFRLGSSDYVVCEACEYKKNFLDLPHTVSVILNVDKDHLDSYDGMEDMTNCFNSFAQNTLSIINADDIHSNSIFNKTTVSFGIKNNASFMAKNIRKRKNNCYSFDFYAYSKRIGRINLSVYGRFNVYNALASAVVCYLLGIDFDHIQQGLKDFKGVKRRSELLGSYQNKVVYADYAHHPKEIEVTSLALDGFDKNTLVVFQPHTYSRTKGLFHEFTAVLGRCNNLIIYDTYSARESYDYDGSAEKLYKELKIRLKERITFVKSKVELEMAIKNYFEFSKIIFFGAGDIYQTAISLITGN